MRTQDKLIKRLELESVGFDPPNSEDTASDNTNDNQLSATFPAATKHNAEALQELEAEATARLNAAEKALASSQRAFHSRLAVGYARLQKVQAINESIARLQDTKHPPAAIRCRLRLLSSLMRNFGIYSSTMQL